MNTRQLLLLLATGGGLYWLWWYYQPKLSYTITGRTISYKFSVGGRIDSGTITLQDTAPDTLTLNTNYSSGYAFTVYQSDVNQATFEVGNPAGDMILNKQVNLT